MGAGKYLATTGASCSNCQAGKYKASAGANTACDSCAAGKFQNQETQQACVDCPAGKYQNQSMQPTCKDVTKCTFEATAATATTDSVCRVGVTCPGVFCVWNGHHIITKHRRSTERFSWLTSHH